MLHLALSHGWQGHTNLNHLLLFPGRKQGVGLEEEQLGQELVLRWDASIAGSVFTSYTVMLATSRNFFFFKLLPPPSVDLKNICSKILLIQFP